MATPAFVVVVIFETQDSTATLQQSGWPSLVDRKATD